jgi:hypothetical protein
VSEKTICIPYTEYLSERKKLREADKVLKELDEACQALHEYRDVYSALKKHLSPDSMAYRHDLRPLAMGEEGTGKRALEALENMPIACKRRDDAYKKACKN